MADDKERSSIYKQYKRDTDSVASWLASTAKQLGYPLDLLSGDNPPPKPPKPAGRLKGKARREARNEDATKGGPEKPKHVIPLHDFTQLANFIAQRGKAVPESFATTVDRLIELRSGFGNLLMQSGKTVTTEEKVHHDYFVDILVGVRELLCPRRKRKPDTGAVPKQEPDDAPSSSDRDLHNRFSALSIDEPSEAFLEKFAAESQHAERPSQPSHDTAIFEAEQQTTDDDLMLLCHALLLDLRAARNSTQAKWASLRDFLYLPATAIATNIDMSICRGFIEEVEPLLEQAEGGSIAVLERVVTLVCPPDEVVAEGPQILPDNRDRSQDEGVLAGRFKYFSNFLLPIKALKAIHDKVIIHDSFFLCPRDSVTLPHDPDHSTLSASEFVSQEVVIIEQSFYDMMLALQTLDGYPIEDELFRAVRRYKNTGKLSITLIFAFQVFLDIRCSLQGCLLKVFEKAKSEMQKTLSDLEAYATLSRQGNRISHRQNNPIMSWLTANRGLLTSFTEDRIFQEKQRISGLTGYNPPEATRHRFLTYSPLMCGLYLFYCRSSLHEIALFTDNSITVITCAHLYNALKKEGLVEASWPDMDEAISLLGDENFWVGSQKPATPYDYWKGLGLRLGVSPSRFTDKCRPGSAKLFRPGTLTQPLTKVRFISHYFPLDTITPFEPLRNMPQRELNPVTNGDVFTWTHSEIENLMIGRSTTSRHFRTGDNSHKQGHSHGTILSIVLKMRLEVESEEMAFPFVQFNYECRSLLTAILQAVQQTPPHESFMSVILDKEILEYVVPSIFYFSMVPERSLLGTAAEATNQWLASTTRDSCLVTARNAGLPINTPIGMPNPETQDQGEQGKTEETESKTWEESTDIYTRSRATRGSAPDKHRAMMRRLAEMID